MLLKLGLPGFLCMLEIPVLFAVFFYHVNSSYLSLM
jgi:hypothetical protein